jgi:hypothetical protein
MSLSNNNNTTAIINPKPCNYNCGTRIYWNTSENAYFEVFAKKKHICPNRSKSNNNVVTQTTTNTKPSYYNKFAKQYQQQPKPKMSNSLELLSGPIEDIQKKYEILSDIVIDLGGKTHGSQSHIANNNSISLIVYFEIPEGKREEMKRKFDIHINTKLENRIQINK